MGITKDEARKELARRELARRGVQQNIPTQESYQDESFGSKLPRNIMTGLANMGHSIINTPHDIMSAIENMGERYNQGDSYWKNRENTERMKLSEKIPYQEEKNFAQMLGQKGPGTFADTAIQKSVEYAPEISLGLGLIRKLPLTQKLGARKLIQAEKAIGERKIGSNVNLGNNHNKLIEASKKFLPESEEAQEILKKAKSGDYKSLFEVQSHLGKAERKLAKSQLFGENRKSAKAGELRQKILNGIGSHYKKYGHEDVANLISSGQKDYRTYKKIAENIYPALTKFGIPIGLGALGYEGVKQIKKNL